MSETPSTLTYTSIVSRDSVCISLTVAALNRPEILSCDIQNSYFNAECQESIWTRAGPEFGSEEGTVIISSMALYGLQCSGAVFCTHLAETLNDIGFLSHKLDPNV